MDKGSKVCADDGSQVQSNNAHFEPLPTSQTTVIGNCLSVSVRDASQMKNISTGSGVIHESCIVASEMKDDDTSNDYSYSTSNIIECICESCYL